MIPCTDLKKAIISALSVASTELEDVGLCGVLLRFHGENTLDVVGSEGHWVLVVALPFAHGQKDTQFILSRPDAQVLVCNLKDGDVCYPFVQGGRLNVGDSSFAQYMDEYPGYEGAINHTKGDLTGEATVDVAGLIQVLKASGLDYVGLRLHNKQSPLVIEGPGVTAAVMPVSERA